MFEYGTSAAGIVAAHNGVIRAESDGRTGTTISVSLPRLASDAIAKGPQEDVTSTRGTGTILVAEDEPLLAQEAGDAIRAAADRLSNTPAICRKSYVHDTIVTAFEDGILERFAATMKGCEMVWPMPMPRLFWYLRNAFSSTV